MLKELGWYRFVTTLKNTQEIKKNMDDGDILYAVAKVDRRKSRGKKSKKENFIIDKLSIFKSKLHSPNYYLCKDDIKKLFIDLSKTAITLPDLYDGQNLPKQWFELLIDAQGKFLYI